MTVLVGSVPTREGRAALRHAAAECLVRKVGLVVVTASDPGRDTDAAELEQWSAALDQETARVRDAGLAVETRTTPVGVDFAQGLVDFAEELTAELIVIGLRRRTPVGKLLLGSNAQRVLLDASCPVLAVKADT